MFYVDRMRDRTIELACLRLGLDERHHKAVDELPEELRARLASTVPASLGDGDLFAALRVVTSAFYDETRAIEPTTTERLEEALVTFIGELESS